MKLEEVIDEIVKTSSAKAKASQEYFGISNINNLGLTVPQMRVIAKKIGTDHALALQLWQSGYHEARHIATMIADPKQTTVKLAEQWLRDLNAWDIVDGFCSSLLRKTPFAYSKAIDWTQRKKEFEKRAGFTMMAQLALHDKTACDKEFENFLQIIKRESDDDRNFVRKAVNWALRQIGKRNVRLCKKAIKTANEIYNKGDASSRWIATDALRELEKYMKEGKIKNIGKP